MREKSERSSHSLVDRFAGFLANCAAQRRGGTAVLAARGQKRQGLLERMAQAEVNRFLRAEIASKN